MAAADLSLVNRDIIAVLGNYHSGPNKLPPLRPPEETTGTEEPWTEIMNSPGQPGLSSASYWEFSSIDTNGYESVPGTSVGSHSNLTIPGLTAGSPVTSGGYDPVCNRNVGTPTQYLESGYGKGVKGLAFVGAFNGQEIPAGDFKTNDSFLFESVFFGESQCYTGGREYGFFYDPYNNGIWAYWGTKENLTSQVQGMVQLTGVQPDTTFRFEIYPTTIGDSCGFRVRVSDLGNGEVFGQWYPVDFNNFPADTSIQAEDRGFCGSVVNGDEGFVTATTIYKPTIFDMPADTSLSLQEIFVR